MTLCRSIFKTDDDSFFEKKSGTSHDGLTTINGNGGAGARLRHENPPFIPRFGVLKVVLNETYTTPTVRIFVFTLFI